MVNGMELEMTIKKQKSGDQPLIKKPGRYRGWHRANKRGVVWAVKHFKLPQMSRILAWMYRDRYQGNDLVDIINRPNPFLSLIPKDSFMCRYLPIPIFFGKNTSRKRSYYRKIKREKDSSQPSDV